MRRVKIQSGHPQIETQIKVWMMFKNYDEARILCIGMSVYNQSQIENTDISLTTIESSEGDEHQPSLRLWRHPRVEKRKRELEGGGVRVM